MNFYKHHIGDYAQATAHLSFIEDAAYSRMLRKYYAEEKPLPADLKAVQRLVGARTREEREAVETVLGEFFELREDGWHNKRADAELARANAQAETNRQIALAREERKKAAKALNEGGTNGARIVHESLDESSASREPSQTPDTRHQTPDNALGRAESVSPELARAVSAEGSVCRALRQAGIADVNPSHPMLRVLLEAGATEAEFLGHAPQAKGKSHPFQWLLARVKGAREDAAQAADGLHQGPLPVAAETPRERAARERVAQATGGLAQSRPPSPPTPFAQPLETAHEPSAAAPALGR